MVSKVQLLFCIFTAGLISLIYLVEGVESENATINLNESPQVTISQDNGVYFEEFINVTGSSNGALSNIYWVIHEVNLDNGGESVNELIVKSNIFSSVEIADNIWFWEVSIPIVKEHCVCQLSIYHNKTNNNIDHLLDSLIFYTGTMNHYPIIEYVPSFQTQMSIGYTNLSYRVVSSPLSSNHPNLLVNSSSFSATICSYTGNTCISEPFLIELNHSIIQENLHQLSINHSNFNLEDGNWLFQIKYRDNQLKYSNSDYRLITFDSTPPKIMFFGNSEVYDMDLEVYSIDLNDGYSGSKVSLTWTITEPGGMVRALLSNEKVNNNSVAIKFNKSGIWKINVLAIDSVGLYNSSNFTVMVSNLPPIISINYNNASISPDQQLQFFIDDYWSIDASNSTDTINDAENLVFEWIVDDEVICTNNTISSHDIKSAGEFDVKLKLNDSKGGVDVFEFQIEINSASNDEYNHKTGILFYSLCIVIFFSTMVFVWLLKRGESKFNLPRWGNNGQRKV